MPGSPLPRDEVLDDTGKLRGPWRQVLGTLYGLGTATVQERRAELDRAVPNGRCDPIPFLFTETEFTDLATGLKQRARLLEALLKDLYGPTALLEDGTLPPSIVYPSPRYVRACRVAGVAVPHLHIYAADLIRAPDGTWQVLADRTDEPAGLGIALENRRNMARILPELFRSMEVAQYRPFFDAWQAVLQRIGPGLALLTPGPADPRWFEHVALAGELGCALVESGDLTVRHGALWIKTLRGLLPVHALLRRQGSAAIDPLELHATTATGVPGLLTVVRSGGVRVLNAAGAGYAESPGLAPFMPQLCRRLLGEALLLPDVPSHWLGDPVSRALVEASLPDWVVHDALNSRVRPVPAASADGAARAALLARIAEQPWGFSAMRRPVPSMAPCAADGERLDPKLVVVRLFLLWNGVTWCPLPGGLARVVDKTDPLPDCLPTHIISKDVWVLLEEGADIMGSGNTAVPSLPLRRTAGDMPSRVADNFFWFGRYLERLENAARLTRATLARLSRAGLLPRDLPELKALAACLAEADVLSDELAAASGPAVLAEMLPRALIRDDGAVAYLTGQIQSLAETLRDRLSGEMFAMVSHGVRGLKGARLALGSKPAARKNTEAPPLVPPTGIPASMGVLADFAQRLLEFSAAVSGYAAENMVRGGGRLFLDLGRRIERAHAVATHLAFALEQPPARIEAGLMLALELCDSMLTYRSRYLSVVQPAPVLDLVLADDGNPRGLGFQLRAARDILFMLDEREDNKLAALLDAPLAELDAIIAELMATADQAAAAAALPARLRAIAEQISALSNAVRRQYFTLLPLTWTESIG